MRNIIVILSRAKHLSAVGSIERCLAALSIAGSYLFGTARSRALSPVVIREQRPRRVKR